MPNDTMLAATHISHTYAGTHGDVPALDDISLDMSRESFVCLVGPSGCGKSTLLRILAGLLRPTTGRALLDGQPIMRAQRRIGVVFQQASLMPWRTVYGNLTLPLELAGLPATEIDQRGRAMLELTGLDG
ncbi:MAG: ATP-binding cassette domain-containing protein, partial [Anaerolineae bacterium]|nr:ATP-binding cassette domain-containing protein [Anaerolineae bacterium]